MEDTISYADLSNIVKREMAQPSALLEHVAGRIAKTVIQTYSTVESVWLRLTKVNPPMGADCSGAGVELEVINEE